MSNMELTEEDIAVRIAARHEENMERIKNYHPLELVEFLEDSINATDIVFEGFQIATALSTSDGIIAAALQRVREAVEAAALWVTENHDLEDDEDEDSENGDDEL